MYYSEFHGTQRDKMWKTSDPMFPGLEFLRVHTNLSSLSLPTALDGTASLGLPLPSRELRETHLPPNKESPPQTRSPHRPGSATSIPTHLPSLTLNSGLNFIQTPKPGILKQSVYSPPPPVSNNPEHNICKLIDFRGSQIAAFSVDNRELICLPQAFELFLKHLVGGLHTVYTKLKRLEITPVVCNVEQVRILRGLGAIQPGVNRCKLISCAEFDTLYDDCTNSNARPGRPAKRVHCSSPQVADAMESFKRRKLDIGKECPYSSTFLDRKPPVMNSFSGIGYTPMPHFSNFFSMHPLMQQLTVAPHLGLRPQGGAPIPETAAPSSGAVSPTARDERLRFLSLSGTSSPLNAGLLRCLPEQGGGCEDTPMNLQTGDNSDDNEIDDSISDDGCLDGDGKESENDRRDGDDDCGSEDLFRTNTQDKSPVLNSNSIIASLSHESQFSDFESLVAKFNAVVRALIDAAKTAGRRFGEERNQIIEHLMREKERCMELEKEMQEERKKREFFQRRAGHLKRALRPELPTVTSSPAFHKTDSSVIESNLEVSVINTPDGSQSEKDCRRGVTEVILSPSHTPPVPSSVKFSHHSVLDPSDV